MKFSRTTVYGLIAAGYIAEYGSANTAVLASTISKEFSIPQEYLLKILQLLVRANILRSKRGPRGGFYLAKSPENTSLLDVIEAIEGTFSSELEANDSAENYQSSSKIFEACLKITQKTRDMFAAVRLSDVIDTDKPKNSQ